jgi:AcrR family transcriptional regulator
VTSETPTGRRADARPRITAAALDLFEAQGYAATTVEAIATEAGVARRTFFLHFRSKDDVVFPDHEALAGAVADLLAGRAEGSATDAVGDAVRLVFASYVNDADVALRRYRLVREIPELREREIAWVQRYQHLFARYLHDRLDHLPHGPLLAEVTASGFVAAHNVALREWLRRGGGGDPMSELDDALAWLTRSLDLVRRGGDAPRMVVAVFDDHADSAEITRLVEQARATP